MNKIFIVTLATVATISLAGCSAREPQIYTVGPVSTTVLSSSLYQNRPVYVNQFRPSYYQPRHPVYVMPPRRPQCFSRLESTYGGVVERRICR
ncbi:hypothetical protein UFOVP787_188 [uncultured Caudovirales phage]|uniref:Lipoprotein n=1 Tax=uncultured Caudovirales phage TaxID=2100421 RepID=A0A6J5P5Y2_9CAUD|nr:hypothetical protein UFOVP787_188 [uncultured Caudovirales phage]